MKTFLTFFMLSTVAFAQAPQEVPSSLPASMRPKSGEDVPAELRATDFFGKAKNPALEAYDPYRSSLSQENRDATLDQLPDGRVLDDLSRKQVIQYGSLPTVAITYGRPVSVLLMRNGRVIVPKKSEIIPPPADMVQVVTTKNAPYIYFNAKSGVQFPGNYPYTHVFIPMELEGRPVQFQIRLKVVAPKSEELLPLVILDMVGDFPDVVEDSASSSSSPASSPSAERAVQEATAQDDEPRQGTYHLNGTGPAPTHAGLTRAEVRDFFPTMIEMAKLYEQAVADRVPGYGREQVQRFRPSSVANGQVVSGGIPAFRNPHDRQLYYLPWGYYFPEYDAVLYEVVFRNSSSEDLWFDYALLKVLFGFEQVTDRAPKGPRNVTAASPENFEKTPAGQYNTLWVLVQGSGIAPMRTPVRFLFPPSGQMSTVPSLVNPVVAPQRTPLNYREGEAEVRN